MRAARNAKAPMVCTLLGAQNPRLLLLRQRGLHLRRRSPKTILKAQHHMEEKAVVVMVRVAAAVLKAGVEVSEVAMMMAETVAGTKVTWAAAVVVGVLAKHCTRPVPWTRRPTRPSRRL